MSSVVKILYTGGTFGMQASEKGLVPSPDLQARVLKEIDSSAEYRSQLDSFAWDWAEQEPLLDSAQMTPHHWEAIQNDCLKAQNFDAIIIIHGTDTLSYTANALAFLLAGENLRIIITGSQIPLGMPGSDALGNFMGALRATKRIKSGVWVYFDQDVLPAVRTVKRDAIGKKGFAAPRLTNKNPYISTFSLSKQENQRRWRDISVSVLQMMPGLPNHHFDEILSGKPQAVILSLYGMGTLNSADQHLMKNITAAISQNIIVVAISQCYIGRVELDTYAAGSPLLDMGVLSAGDMTLEAAYCKLMVLFRLGYTVDEIKILFVRSILGELG